MANLNELDALCETSLKVHVGEEEVEISPPTLAKLNATAPFWAKLIKHATEKFKDVDSKDINIEVILKDIYGFVEDLLPILKIYLAPRGKVESKFSIDQIREGLDIGDIKRIMKFVQVGDLLKNVLTPMMPVEMTVSDRGQKT
jgi:hypothetical protein